MPTWLWPRTWLSEQPSRSTTPGSSPERARLPTSSSTAFCTMIYGHLRLGDGAPSLDLLNCGHPAPLFMRAEGQIDQVECRGPLLGQFPSTTVDPVALAPLPGDVLVFVTDGVLEARAPRS